MVSISFCSKRYLYEGSLSEYEATSRRLRDSEALDEDPYVLYSKRNSPVFDIISKFLGELPMVCSFLPFNTAFQI